MNQDQDLVQPANNCLIAILKIIIWTTIPFMSLLFIMMGFSIYYHNNSLTLFVVGGWYTEAIVWSVLSIFILIIIIRRYIRKRRLKKQET